MVQAYTRALREETLARSPSASISFVSIAIICWAAGLYSEADKNLIMVFLLLLIPLNNVIRTIPLLHFKRYGQLPESMWLLFCISAVQNGMIWGAAIVLGISSQPESQWATTFYLLIAVGFSNASIFTQGLNRAVHMWFLASLNLPAVFYLFFIAQKNQNQIFLSIAIILSISSVHALFQGRTYFKRFLEKIQADQALLKSQQDLLEQRAMTEHANRLASLGEVSAGVAHEINNPLSIVTGSLNLLETQMKKNAQLSEQHATYIHRSFNALNRIQKIVKAMSILSMRSSSPIRLEEHPNSIVDQALSIFSEKIYQNRIIVKRDLRCDDHLVCDPTQLTQIIVNLMNNAIDAIQSAERDTDRWILIETESIDRNLVLSISNGGPAIAREVAAKLFTPFFTTKAVGQGTGLGLSISRSIALQHNGDLQYDPVPSHTRFKLSLPLSSTKQKKLDRT